MLFKHDKQKEHSLTGRITLELLEKAFKAVKKNRGAAGVDKVSISMYEANLEENLLSLMKEMKSRNFKTSPLRRVHIPKGKDGSRALGIPTVRDRVAQDVIRRLLSPIYERTFHDHSYGFRPGRGCHHALQKVIDLKGKGKKWVLDADIKGFFDNIPHSLIEEAIAAKVADGNIIGIVKEFLRSGVLEEGRLRPTIKGTPQGGVVSPLLANIALNPLDWFLEEKGYAFVRYADDFVILCETELQAEKALEDIRYLLEDQMGLTLSPEKTKISQIKNGFEFLGYRIGSRYAGMRDKSVEKFKTKIRSITRRKLNCDAKVIERLNEVIRGTVNYFCTEFSTNKTIFRQFDRWIRTRLRCMIKKRKWETDNRRIKNKHLARRGLLSSMDHYMARRCRLLFP